MESPSISYVSYRVETYAKGEGKRRYKFDGRTNENLVKAREFANAQFNSGKKVTFYKLSRDVNGSWHRDDESVMDGRPESEKKKPEKKQNVPVPDSFVEVLANLDEYPADRRWEILKAAIKLVERMKG